VVVFWEEKAMQPKEKRAMALSYGLSFCKPPVEQLALTYLPRPLPGSDFTVTAWIKHPQPGQKVKLSLPQGFTFKAGAPAEQVVSKREHGLGKASWIIQAGPTAGEHVVSAESEQAKAQLEVQVLKRSRLVPDF
jgi:hypothetical protein